jgi:hemerythrin-like domain-containing protein
MLGACHTRVEKQCRTLERLIPHLHQHGCDADAREAATAVMRYFDTAAVHHHADEEEDLFPALEEAMAGSDAVCIRDLCRLLRSEHRALEQRWQDLRTALQAMAEGQSAELSADRVSAFISAYRQHIAREDSELIPMARRLLGESALADMGRAMALRRGLKTP